MHSVGTPMLWGGFAVVVLIMLAIDLVAGLGYPLAPLLRRLLVVSGLD